MAATRRSIAFEAERAAKETLDSAGIASANQAPVAPAERAQLYSADITLRVKDLSETTQDALRRTRALGGYVRSVDYGEGDGEGTARLVLRVPIARVQTAILRYSELGTILDQHVSVRDVQPRLDRRFERIAELRRVIPTLAGDELATAQAELEALQTAQQRERRQASFATASLNLTTKDAQVAVPTEPGRIQRALERAVRRARRRDGCRRLRGRRRCAVRPARRRAAHRRPGRPAPLGPPPAGLLEQTRLWMHWHRIGTFPIGCFGRVRGQALDVSE